MTIRLNGDVREFRSAMTVTALLEELGLDPRTVAVELDRLVVKRAAYGTTTIEDGAEVEIVAFVGGG